jgi:pSer/pThr/pTyr-binding forkhead associated (FHA) protein
MSDRPHNAILFCPPQPPLRLRRGANLVIGRHHSCDLSIRCEDVSRRHAEVRATGSQFEIEDLSSTNGTFVNGQKISGIQPLLPGDKIEIGSSLITFCFIEAAMGSGPVGADGGKTVVQLPGGSPQTDAFRGALSEIPPFALLQVMEMGSKTGILTMENPEGVGRIWFDNGFPVHAECEKRLGFDAAVTLVLGTHGSFRFEPQRAVTVERTIEASVTELLLEASRQADEASRGT